MEHVPNAEEWGTLSAYYRSFRSGFLFDLIFFFIWNSFYCIESQVFWTGERVTHWKWTSCSLWGEAHAQWSPPSSHHHPHSPARFGSVHRQPVWWHFLNPLIYSLYFFFSFFILYKSFLMESASSYMSKAHFSAHPRKTSSWFMKQTKQKFMKKNSYLLFGGYTCIYIPIYS